MHTSGLILDVYDDVEGSTVRTAFPGGNVPDSVKVAHNLSHEDRSALPDDLFALVVTDGNDIVMRKYACVDQGNTELNVLYFLDHGHKLDSVMREKVAQNLTVACGWYGIQVPEQLEKVALGLGTAMSLASAPSLVKGVSGEAKRNLAVVRAGERATGGTAGGLGALAEHKLGEVVGTDIMPVSHDIRAKLRKDDMPLSKSAKMEPVAVCGEKKASVKTASQVSALNGRYPLDSYADVQLASTYFEKHARKLPVEDRREFALSLTKRAAELNIPCGELAEAYGQEKRASDETWGAALSSRREHVRSDPSLLSLLSKVAEQREEVPPDTFAQVLLHFDKMAGLHYHYDLTVLDPFLSAYGAEEYGVLGEGKLASDDAYLDTSTGRGITGQDIKRFAAARRDYAAKMFGEDVATQLGKDPIGTYTGMVSSRRQVLANMIAEFIGSGPA